MRLPAAALIVLIAATPALAGEVDPDCRMTDGAAVAEAPVDVGNGKLMVRITETQSDGAKHALMLVDCQKGEAVIGLGDRQPLNPSDAPFNFSPDRAVSDVVADLKGFGLRGRLMAHDDMLSRFPLAETPFCGCTIFYPDSPGASAQPVNQEESN